MQPNACQAVDTSLDSQPTLNSMHSVHFGDHTLIKEFRSDTEWRQFLERGEITEDIDSKIHKDEHEIDGDAADTAGGAPAVSSAAVAALRLKHCENDG